MYVKAIKTKKILSGDSIFELLDNSVTKLGEGEILIITSKIISICEGSVEGYGKSKEELVEQQADYILEGEKPYGMMLTIKNNIIIPNAGIDESNIEEGYVLWPENPQESANMIWEYLRKKHGIKHLGIVITDSKTTPLRRGTTGVAIAHCGFRALNDYIGEEDLFGREMLVSMANIAEGLAAVGVLLMGEGSEQTPLAIARGLESVFFTDCIPEEAELLLLNIGIDEDIYSPILKSARWKKLR